jgi:hypothetical protein
VPCRGVGEQLGINTDTLRNWVKHSLGDLDRGVQVLADCWNQLQTSHQAVAGNVTMPSVV